MVGKFVLSKQSPVVAGCQGVDLGEERSGLGNFKVPSSRYLGTYLGRHKGTQATNSVLSFMLACLVAKLQLDTT